MKLTEKQLNNMKHCIGWGFGVMPKRGKINSYRNYFTTATREDWAEDLVTKELMMFRELPKDFGGGICYYVTEDGFKYIEEIENVKIIREG